MSRSSFAERLKRWRAGPRTAADADTTAWRPGARWLMAAVLALLLAHALGPLELPGLRQIER